MVQNTLTVNEQKALRSWSGVIDLLIAPDQFKPPELSGASHCMAFDDERHWLDVRTKGLSVGLLGSEPVVVVKWPKARRYAATLDRGLVSRLRKVRLELAKHQAGYPSFRVPADLAGCGRPKQGEPLSPDQERYAALYEQWRAGDLAVYWAERSVLTDTIAALLDEAFPLASNLCRCTALVLPHLHIEGMCA